MGKLKFDYPEDKLFFETLLCTEGENIEKYYKLFDFREPHIKRHVFNKERAKLLDLILERQGLKCALNFDHICNLDSGININHIIPLSTNKLNKGIRNLKAEPGKKVKTQSFGSNNLENLILTCRNCNNHKKHRILYKPKIRELISISS